MTLRIIAAAVLLVAFASPATGQTDKPLFPVEELRPPEPADSVWWKTSDRLTKEHPDYLWVHYIQRTRECPFTEASIESIIDGLLVRSHLKQRYDGNDEAFRHKVSMASVQFHLLVEVGCEDEPPYRFEVHATFRESVTVQKPGGVIKIYMSHLPGYARWGTYNPDTEQNTNFLRNSIRDLVEDALTDYLNANFDL